MNINNAFPSKYLRSADIEDNQELLMTIRDVITEHVGYGDRAQDLPVLYFQEEKKGLVLRPTNAFAIADVYGPETDGWVGKPIALVKTTVMAFGEMTPAIRVRVQDLNSRQDGRDDRAELFLELQKHGYSTSKILVKLKKNLSDVTSYELAELLESLQGSET